MAVSRRVGNEKLSYEQAKDKGFNVLHKLGYYRKQAKLYQRLYTNQGLIAERVAHHSGLRFASLCRVEKPIKWLKRELQCLRSSLYRWVCACSHEVPAGLSHWR